MVAQTKDSADLCTVRFEEGQLVPCKKFCLCQLCEGHGIQRNRGMQL